jgi:uncharacterized protein YlaN (UPF0358 family)
MLMTKKRSKFLTFVLWHEASNITKSDNPVGKQILAQQPFGISRHICFFYEVGLSDQCPQPLLNEGKTMTYLGLEPGTFGYQVGNATN